MGGGLGFMPDVDDILRVISALPEVHATVVTGRNEKLRHELEARYADEACGIEILGYTDDIPRCMETADVIVTKPGGITMFESIQSELPMFVMDPYFEQEKANAAYIEREQIGKVVREHGQDCSREFERFLSDTRSHQRMKENMHGIKESIRGGGIDRVMDELMTAC